MSLPVTRATAGLLNLLNGRAFVVDSIWLEDLRNSALALRNGSQREDTVNRFLSDVATACERALSYEATQ